MARLNGFNGDLKCPLTSIPTVESEIVSPMIGKSHNLDEPFRPDSIEFEYELTVFKDVREQVRKGEWPTEFLATDNPSGLDGDVPELLKTAGVRKYDPLSAARLVEMDDPVDVGIHLFKELRKRGIPLKNQYNHIPFVEEFVRFIKVLSERLEAILIKAFEAKYYFGLERPETYLEIDGDIITDAVDGAPNHFSYPAGHGSVFAETFNVLDEFFDMDEMAAYVLDALWQGAHYRTLLGVHYPQDNTAGFKLAGVI